MTGTETGPAASCGLKLVAPQTGHVRWGYCGACHDWTGDTIAQLTLDIDAAQPRRGTG